MNRHERRKAAREARLELGRARQDLRRQVQAGKISPQHGRALLGVIESYAAKHPANAARRGRTNETRAIGGPRLFPDVLPKSDPSGLDKPETVVV